MPLPRIEIPACIPPSFLAHLATAPAPRRMPPRSPAQSPPSPVPAAAAAPRSPSWSSAPGAALERWIEGGHSVGSKLWTHSFLDCTPQATQTATEMDQYCPAVHVTAKLEKFIENFVKITPKTIRSGIDAESRFTCLIFEQREPESRKLTHLALVRNQPRTTTKPLGSCRSRLSPTGTVWPVRCAPPEPQWALRRPWLQLETPLCTALLLCRWPHRFAIFFPGRRDAGNK